MSEVTHSESGGPIVVRKWIGDVSAERIGQVWRAEDHEALLRTIDDDTTLARREPNSAHEASARIACPEGPPRVPPASQGIAFGN